MSKPSGEWGGGVHRDASLAVVPAVDGWVVGVERDGEKSVGLFFLFFLSLGRRFASVRFPIGAKFWYDGRVMMVGGWSDLRRVSRRDILSVPPPRETQSSAVASLCRSAVDTVAGGHISYSC